MNRPLPQTVWSKNGKLIKSFDRITQGNYGKSLIIKLVDFDDEGAYTCEISNGVGEAKSYSINLKVLGIVCFVNIWYVCLIQKIYSCTIFYGRTRIYNCS